jgi:ABC-type nickel/cobalt efflux system permease component RcnA
MRRPDVRRILLILALALVAAIPLLGPHRALAHPLGNFTLNRYARIEVFRDRLQVHYVVDMAEIPTFQAMDAIDSDRDGTASLAELDTYGKRLAETYRKSFTLKLDGRTLEPAPLETSVQLLPGQGGLNVTRIVILYGAPVPSLEDGKSVSISWDDRNLLGSQGWKEVVVRASEGAQITVDPKLTVDQSDALLHYPAETLKSAPDVSQVAFTWVEGTGSAAPPTANLQVGTAGRDSSGVSGIFEKLLHHNQSLGFIALSLLIAFAFGAQHAFGPGHGKTMVAAYLVGSKGTPKQAVILGLTVTATHTSTVYLLGIVTLVAAAYVTPETLYLWMGLASGALVVIFGATLFIARLWGLRRRAAASGAHRHGLFGRAHTHEPAHAPHPVEAHMREHDRPHAGADVRVTWRSLLSLGVIGGLLPCPSAVVVMVAAISQGQVALGMLLIVAFSLGLAGVLTGIGVSLVLGRRIPERHRRLLERPLATRLVATMPVLSALVVMLVGVGITYQAWNI